MWPHGLGGLVDHVHNLGMEFGLWFEPEMVNPDSNLYREHPEWILSAEGRVPLLHRNQLVLDLSNPDVWTYLRDRVDAVLSAHAIDYVKWDHNRDLLEAGSAVHGGAPAVHAQNVAYYALLDDLRTRHPAVAWESCAAGGGRIDLGAIERVQRFWTSDMTDALARQHIQRWTEQLVAPEYLGAHISAPQSHQTGRTFSLDFRAATAFFLAFGIEWDLTQATPRRAQGAGLVVRAAQEVPSPAAHRPVRPPRHRRPAVLAHGVVAQDRDSAILCHVQLDESQHNRGSTLRVDGLNQQASYRLEWLGPVDLDSPSMSPPLSAAGPTHGETVTGRQLAELGIWVPRRPPETALLMHVARASAE